MDSLYRVFYIRERFRYLNFYFIWFLDLFRVYASVTFSSVTLGRVYSMMPDQKKNMSAARSVFRVIDRKSKIDSLSEKGVKPSSIEGNIRFENVFFSYPNRPDVQVLNGFSLDCPRNKTNALVGSSGKYRNGF